MKIKSLFLIGFFGAFIISCTNGEGVFFLFDDVAHQENQAKWEDQNLQNYQFDQYYMSSATGPIYETVIVRNGVAESLAGIDEGSFIIGDISAIYAKILADFNEQKNQQTLPMNGITVKVKYNKEYYFPEEVNFSVSYEESIVGGPWYDLKISNFEVLED